MEGGGGLGGALGGKRGGVGDSDGEDEAAAAAGSVAPQAALAQARLGARGGFPTAPAPPPHEGSQAIGHSGCSGSGVHGSGPVVWRATDPAVLCASPPSPTADAQGPGSRHTHGPTPLSAHRRLRTRSAGPGGTSSPLRHVSSSGGEEVAGAGPSSTGASRAGDGCPADGGAAASSTAASSIFVFPPAGRASSPLSAPPPTTRLSPVPHPPPARDRACSPASPASTPPLPTSYPSAGSGGSCGSTTPGGHSGCSSSGAGLVSPHPPVRHDGTGSALVATPPTSGATSPEGSGFGHGGGPDFRRRGGLGCMRLLLLAWTRAFSCPPRPETPPPFLLPLCVTAWVCALGWAGRRLVTPPSIVAACPPEADEDPCA